MTLNEALQNPKLFEAWQAIQLYCKSYEGLQFIKREWELEDVVATNVSPVVTFESPRSTEDAKLVMAGYTVSFFGKSGASIAMIAMHGLLWNGEISEGGWKVLNGVICKTEHGEMPQLIQ